MYITRLQTNVKIPRDIALGPCTLVVGGNADGKSAIIEALRLALTGRSDEVGAVGVEMMTLAPHGAGELYARVETDTQGVLELCVSGSTSRASKPEWRVEGVARPQVRGVEVAPAVLLNAEILRLLRTEPKALRQALLRVAVGDIDIEPIVREILPSAFLDDWRTIWTKAKEGAESVPDAVIAAADIIKDEVKRTRAAAKFEGERPDAPSAEDVRELDRRVSEARFAREQRSRRDGLVRQLEALHATITRVREAEGQPTGPTPEQVRLARSRLDAGDLLRDWLARTGGALDCTACGAAPDYHRIEVAAEQAATFRQQLADVLAVTPALPHLADLEARRDALMEELAKPVPADPGDTTEIEMLLPAKRTALVAAEQYDKQASEARRAAARLDALVALGRAVDRMVAETLIGAVSGFAERASTALPAGAKLYVQLFDGRRAVCRVGITRNGQMTPWRTLSGAERVMFLGALGTAWATRFHEPMRIAVCDETWIDRDHLGSVLAGLRAATLVEGGVTQVIVAVCDHYGTVPDGWTLVDLRQPLV